ncbi:universal stress protein [Halarchaeum nitratireducens]|uniref:UspA domain-containing protein n=1 Tax=Halarchaeum nitratireducens TaxID=489913 RepID=A0A830G9J0_9EURY|nr:MULTISPECIES: universal stress protein [Halarchaeum]MBP2249838.1 nucleotide-binding universal stress UspA family protein [Halarchaeum solikamskense]GGN10255.1 hypothetical protein GCM10009021_07550 [Halarchaeum nitratireducens]
MSSRTVLVAVSRDENDAIRVSETVERLYDADEVEVGLVHCFTENPEGASAAQLSSVRHASERLEAAGFDVEIHERSGDPASEVLEAAVEIGADLVCLGGRRRSAAGKVMFGSTAQSVLHDADRPVVLAPGPT